MVDGTAAFKKLIENWVRPFFGFSVRSLEIDVHRQSYTLILHQPEFAFSDRWFTVFADEFERAVLNGLIPEYLLRWIQDEMRGPVVAY